jgi:heme exporter protein A
MTALLEFKDLAVTRGDRTLLRALNAQLDRGEALHIRGANGAGKTSLLEVLCGLRLPAEGRLHRAFDSGECHWVGHRNGLNLGLSAFENLRFWCALQGAPSEGIRGALREQGLLAVADHPCRQLSAGQARRVALARLSITRRLVWFLDEPLSALDGDSARRWAALLSDHLRQGGAAVITSHQDLPGTVNGLRTLDLH